jgi:hypothetical protein
MAKCPSCGHDVAIPFVFNMQARSPKILGFHPTGVNLRPVECRHSNYRQSESA